jgi:hypothetical protein
MDKEKGIEINRLVVSGIVPFTGGLIIFVYAFFWPESYGRWLGTIVHSFRIAAGF